MADIYRKIDLVMACACKKNTNRQVSSVKQVTKKPVVNRMSSNNKPAATTSKPVIKRIIYKRPI